MAHRAEQKQQVKGKKEAEMAPEVRLLLCFWLLVFVVVFASAGLGALVSCPVSGYSRDPVG